MGGYLAIVGGILLIITGTNIIPLLSVFTADMDSPLITIGLGSGVVLGGILLIKDIMEGGGIGIGCTAMYFSMFIIFTAFSGGGNSFWLGLLALGIAFFGSVIGLLQSPEFKVKKDEKIEEILHPLENILLEKFNILKIEYYGRYFGGLFFLIELKDGQDEYILELLAFLEGTLNQKVCLASKVIPESILLKDDMYYLFRLKHNILKTGRRRIDFIREGE